MTENTWVRLHRDLEDGRALVLARIVRLEGSGPRGLGAACIVYADGTLHGTVGGGLLEHRVLQKAAELFDSRRTALLCFRLTGKDLAASDMVCGGVADIYLEPMDPADVRARKIFRLAAEQVGSRGHATLYTRVSDGARADAADLRLLAAPDGTDLGQLPGGGRHWPQHGRPVLLAAAEGQPALFADPVAPHATLVIFGAGHVSMCLAPLALSVGFEVVVCDDRAEFASPERFPGVDVQVPPRFHEALSGMEVTPRTYIAIMTRGHTSDLAVLLQAVRSQPAYIGLMASARKRRMIVEKLKEEGTPAASIEALHTPIGLDIEADTPQEIAVSIVAELIRVRARRMAAGVG